MHIPICDPKQEYLELKREIDAAIHGVLESGQYILGPNVSCFEEEMAAYLGCQYAVGVNSGTDAMHLALRALGIGPGDEVITTPFTFIATTEAIEITGATPVFADIDPHTFNIDPNRVEDAITSHTRAILPVHLYGQPCEMDAIMDLANRHDLRVVEDCAQAIGATYCGKRVGTFGDVGCFSFFPSKNLGCIGDGGLTVTDDSVVQSRLAMLRRHGARVKYHHSELGLNSRLDEVQAALLRVKLPRLDAWNEKRRERAILYNDLLADLAEIKCPSERNWHETEYASVRANNKIAPVYHQYTVLLQNRASAAQHLVERGIGNAVYYPVPLHLQEVNAQLGFREGSFPHSEYASRHCLSLPMSPNLTRSQQEEVHAALRQALADSPHPRLISA